MRFQMKENVSTNHMTRPKNTSLERLTTTSGSDTDSFKTLKTASFRQHFPFKTAVGIAVGLVLIKITRNIVGRLF